MEALIVALSPGMQMPGACNAGFLRDEALLVVVVLTDEDDENEMEACMGLPQGGSVGGPADWFATIADAKGAESNAVILGLWSPSDDPCPPLDQCNGGILGAEPAPRLTEWAHLFTWRSIEQVCAPSFDPFFDDAIPLVEAACSAFVAP